MLPDRNSYSLFENFISPSINENINNILSLNTVEWFPFSTNKLSRFETRKFNSKFCKPLFTLLNEQLCKLGLKIHPDVIHPRLFKKNDWIDWHSDFSHLPISDIIEYECILVLKNTSDSLTKFKTDTNCEESVATKENDLLIVCRHGIEHCVTKVTQGERLTLKFTAIEIKEPMPL